MLPVNAAQLYLREGTMGPSHCRLPVQLPLHKTTLEEIILARKMIPSPEMHDDHDPAALLLNIDDERGPTTDYPRRRGMLATPACPASWVSRLPPESYVRDVSNRLGKRPRSNLVRRANMSNRGRVGLKSGTPWQQQQQQQYLRPLTGVSPPPTAPRDTFSLADYTAAGTLRPAVSGGAAVRHCFAPTSLRSAQEFFRSLRRSAVSSSWLRE